MGRRQGRIGRTGRIGGRRDASGFVPFLPLPLSPPSLAPAVVPAIELAQRYSGSARRADRSRSGRSPFLPPSASPAASADPEAAVVDDAPERFEAEASTGRCAHRADRRGCQAASSSRSGESARSRSKPTSRPNCVKVDAYPSGEQRSQPDAIR